MFSCSIIIFWTLVVCSLPQPTSLTWSTEQSCLSGGFSSPKERVTGWSRADRPTAASFRQQGSAGLSPHRGRPPGLQHPSVTFQALRWIQSQPLMRSMRTSKCAHRHVLEPAYAGPLRSAMRSAGRVLASWRPVWLRISRGGSIYTRKWVQTAEQRLSRSQLWRIFFFF